MVEAEHDAWLARLVPVELAEHCNGTDGAIVLRATVEDVRKLPVVHEVSYLRLDGFLVDDPAWDIGIQEVLAMPYYADYGPRPASMDYAVDVRPIPKGEVEIRRASEVESADGHRVGHVDGLLVDEEELITHVVVEHGPPWERREVAVPIGTVATRRRTTWSRCA